MPWPSRYLADLLAVASDRMGYTEVALVAHALADDARRGVVPQARLMELVRVCSRVEDSRRSSPSAAPQPDRVRRRAGSPLRARCGSRES